jgi:hypothetical protein
MTSRRQVLRPLPIALAALIILAGAVAAGADPARNVVPKPGVVGCPPGAPPRAVSDEYKRRVAEAVGSREDVWGNAVMSRPNGPTYDAVKGYLRPVWWALDSAGLGGSLTYSWAYYIPFGQPIRPGERGQIALHVADGSQIISNRSRGPSTVTYVGTRGEERFGECLADLAAPRLFNGYQPVLEVEYTDYDGIRYRQESFATFIPRTKTLASYIKITANRAGSAQKATKIRFDVCACTLSREGNKLFAPRRTHLFFSPDARFSEHSLVYDLDLSDGTDHSVYVVRLNSPSSAPLISPSEATHVAARNASIRYWAKRLSNGTTFVVPEHLVMDAQRNVLIQNLLMTWRYSLGNRYEKFSQPESSDTVETLGRYGFTRLYRGSLEELLVRSKGSNRRNFEIGEKLLRAADYYWLTRDASFIHNNKRVHARYAADLARQQRINAHGLLVRQQYSSDVTHRVYGLHQISRALYGLKAIIAVWRRTGHADLAGSYTKAARALDAALQRAVKKSTATLDDGSLFTSVELHGRVKPYDPITATHLGGYWNLVAPYGFASKIYAPRSVRARRTLQYLYSHGSRLLGGVRSRLAGVADVYGVEQAKFLADNDEADQLVVSLYGNLVHGRTPGTFIAGEVANVGPLAHKWPEMIGHCHVGRPCTRPELPNAWSPMDSYRGMYRPPNSANNTVFLSILRNMLVHEVTNDAHVPQGLTLGFATPRSWLEDGKDIAVRRAPTFFGRVSYRIHSALARNIVTAAVRVPERKRPRTLLLRLRVPQLKRMIAVTVNGRRHRRFDPGRELINLTGLRGKLRIRVNYSDSRSTRGADAIFAGFSTSLGGGCCPRR